MAFILKKITICTKKAIAHALTTFGLSLVPYKIATVEQMRQQIESHKNELGKKHEEAELSRKQQSDEIVRLNKNFSTQISEAFSKKRTKMEEVASSSDVPPVVVPRGF